MQVPVRLSQPKNKRLEWKILLTDDQGTVTRLELPSPRARKIKNLHIPPETVSVQISLNINEWGNYTVEELQKSGGRATIRDPNSGPIAGKKKTRVRGKSQTRKQKRASEFNPTPTPDAEDIELLDTLPYQNYTIEIYKFTTLIDDVRKIRYQAQYRYVPNPNAKEKRVKPRPYANKDLAFKRTLEAINETIGNQAIKLIVHQCRHIILNRISGLIHQKLIDTVQKMQPELKSCFEQLNATVCVAPCTNGNSFTIGFFYATTVERHKSGYWFCLGHSGSFERLSSVTEPSTGCFAVASQLAQMLNLPLYWEVGHLIKIDPDLMVRHASAKLELKKVESVGIYPIRPDGKRIHYKSLSNCTPPYLGRLSRSVAGEPDRLSRTTSETPWNSKSKLGRFLPLYDVERIEAIVEAIKQERFKEWDSREQ